ncbi:hypothetical protein [Williamsia muralis]|uniref:hypothetical protein n=1 Tax=Williamsia marianensis TaxID=85044 RepID=UPI000DE6ED26|nr:hypothetical protein [Williamsia marianensis]PVY28355.1 hypothetical protein C7458_10824 [Williamsia marianensis]
MMLWVIAGLVALLVVVTAVGAPFEDDSDSDTASRANVTPTDFSYPTSTATLAPPPPAARTTITGPAQVRCKTAPDAYVAVIEASLTDASLSLANLQSLTAPGGLLYIGADIVRGEERESTQDTWVVEDDVVMALSSSANEFTILPDGRDLLDVTVSAGDEHGSALQNCVARVRQGG